MSGMGKIKDGWVYASDYFNGEDDEFPEWVDYLDTGRGDRVSMKLYEDKLSYRWYEVTVNYRIRLSDGKIEIISTTFDKYERVTE